MAPSIQRFCFVVLAIIGVVHALVHGVGARRRVVIAAQDSEVSLESMNAAAGPMALPEGGYLGYRMSAPPLEREACDTSVPKEPLRGRMDHAVLLAAREQLNLPMGAGRQLTVRGKAYLFCLEPHYHPPGYGAGPEGWHKGVTVYYGSQPEERRL